MSACLCDVISEPKPSDRIFKIWYGRLSVTVIELFQIAAIMMHRKAYFTERSQMSCFKCRLSHFSWKWILTYSMVQSPSWEANWFAASQVIPRISRNPKIHYRTHKRPPPVSILGQPNSVHIPTSYLLEILPNIIHPSTPRSPQWSPSLRFPQQDPIHPPLLTHTRHMPSPSHSSRFVKVDTADICMTLVAIFMFIGTDICDKK